MPSIKNENMIDKLYPENGNKSINLRSEVEYLQIILAKEVFKRELIRNHRKNNQKFVEYVEKKLKSNDKKINMYLNEFNEIEKRLAEGKELDKQHIQDIDKKLERILNENKALRIKLEKRRENDIKFHKKYLS